MLADRRGEWLPRVFPAGKIRAGVFYLGDADGAAGDSLPVPLKANGAEHNLKDFAGHFSGDDLALFGRGRGHGDDQRRAYRDALEYLGIERRETHETAHETREYRGAQATPPSRANDITASWTYVDEHGKPWIEVVRRDPPGQRKRFSQFNHREQLWTGAGGGTLPEPRPLYRLTDITGRKDERVVFVAGEKCVEALTEIGVLATTNIGGEEALDKTDLTPLKGRMVCVWRDNDETGQKWQAQLTSKLRALGCWVTLVEPPEHAPRKWDAADALLSEMATADVLALIESASAAPTTLVCVSGLEFLSMALPKREQLFGPLVTRQSLSMVYAERGVGKTWFAIGVAWAIATGGTFLKWQAEKPARVLYLDGEMPGGMLQERLLDYQNSRHFGHLTSPFTLRLVTPDLQTKTMPDIATPEGREHIAELLPGTDLVVVDNISTLVRGGVENEAESWVPIQEWALDLRRQGIAVLFVHHAGKSGKQRGTSKREDALDTVVSLRHPDGYEPDEGTRFEIHFEKTRGFAGKDAESLVAGINRDSDGSLFWDWQPLIANKRAEAKEMAEAGKSIRSISAELGVGKSTVERWLKSSQP